jgi:hypothetical protein
LNTTGVTQLHIYERNTVELSKRTWKQSLTSMS